LGNHSTVSRRALAASAAVVAFLMWGLAQQFNEREMGGLIHVSGGVKR
jgi:hypothetical protein